MSSAQSTLYSFAFLGVNPEEEQPCPDVRVEVFLKPYTLNSKACTIILTS
jgi:hypothetical protein